ncbi:MAG: SusD/RagB family nutrient-binding outer membrane lipoprotein [Bacteroidota bacterium]|nr:SusD/RagB family nutrient-binding outer membrane lipoprotein [Bacteroidota bacterium]
MKTYKLKISALLMVVALMITGCTSTFDKVNTDPDNPNAQIVPATNILAYCLRYSSDNMFDEWFDLNESCGFSGQIAKWMYTDEGYYSFRPTVNTASWNVCYYTVSNLQSVIDKSEVGSNMWAAATIFQCQIFQVISDRWGNVPYSNALKLASGVTKPTYDKQSAIYPDLLKRLKAAVEALGTKSDKLGAGDVLLNGNITAWKKYGNSLRLRIAARIANVDPNDAKSTFEEILGNPSKYPVLASNSDNVFFQWNSEYPEPYADYYQTRPNEYGVSKLMVETLSGTNDPRLSVYAKPTSNYTNGVSGAAQYAGYQNGLEATAAVAAYSGIGTRFMSTTSLTGFSPWMRSCETYFAIAYAASKGWNVGMTQQAAYEQAVTLSIQENGGSASDVSTFLANGGKYDGTQAQLFTQWWVSVFKNGMEAWSLFRMSGYPSGNVIAPDSYFPGHNTPPMCYGYPDTERNLNKENCAPEAAAESDYFWGKQMWWDKRTGLK